MKLSRSSHGSEATCALCETDCDIDARYTAPIREGALVGCSGCGATLRLTDIDGGYGDDGTEMRWRWTVVGWTEAVKLKAICSLADWDPSDLPAALAHIGGILALAPEAHTDA